MVTARVRVGVGVGARVRVGVGVRARANACRPLVPTRKARFSWYREIQ